MKDICKCGKPKDYRSEVCFQCKWEVPKVKYCKGCEVDLPIEKFQKRMKRGKPTYRTKCKECESNDRSEFAKNNRKILNEQKKRAYNKNPDINRKKRTRSHWKQQGYDINEISEYYDNHNGKCDICGKTAFESKHGNKNLSIDHDHKTKKIRGMICSPCNIALGLIDDNAEIALKMAKYLMLNENGGGVQIYPRKIDSKSVLGV